jgi:hypothetical protein
MTKKIRRTTVKIPRATIAATTVDLKRMTKILERKKVVKKTKDLQMMI